jgi:hypothetical protein
MPTVLSPRVKVMVLPGTVPLPETLQEPFLEVSTADDIEQDFGVPQLDAMGQIQVKGDVGAVYPVGKQIRDLFARLRSDT